MRASNERLTVLSVAEQSALYELPDFDEDQRLEYLTLTNQEQTTALSCPHLSAKIYCLLQIRYFKAKKMFFRFTWEEVTEDTNFILQQYFPEKSIFDSQIITKHEHYTQCNRGDDIRSHGLSKYLTYLFLLINFFKRLRFLSCLSVRIFFLFLNGFSPCSQNKRTGVPTNLKVFRK